MEDKRVRKTRIALVDDQTVLREALARTLALEPDFDVVAAWSSAEQLLAALVASRPDVAVIDLVLPGMNGIDATREIRAHHPQTNVVLLSGLAREQQIVEGLEAGALAFLPKECSTRELADVVRNVARGKLVLSPALTRQVLSVCQRMQNGNGHGPPLLTEAQVNVLLLAGSGYANKEIADRLGLNINTVKLRLKEAFTRLGARDRTHAVLLAMKHGLFGVSDALP